MIKWLLFFGVVIISSSLLFVMEYFHFHDSKLHVVFCNVGQGDAIFIRTPQYQNVLIDAGPDKSVLECLAKHLPFWDRTVTLALLSHPHADHFMGFRYVLGQYHLLHFAREQLSNPTAEYQAFETALHASGEKEQIVHDGDLFRLSGGIRLKILGPTTDFINQTSPQGTIGESSEFASLVIQLTYGSFDTIFTGDTQAPELAEATNELPSGSIEVLQSPHHGSKTGLTADLLDHISPHLGVISVGKNKYGHPSPETLALFSSQSIPTKRTDQVGDVEIVSDGKMWKVK